MGGDCVFNASEDGRLDLAETAAKLSSLDMMVSDMQCGIDPATANTEAEAEAALSTCELFRGEARKCKKVVLGLADCCEAPSGVSLYEYLQLTFAVSRLNTALTDLGVATPVQSAWTSMEAFGRNSFSKLTQPITQSWESIVGNSGVAKGLGNSFSLAAAKQAMMNKVASWTANTFGTQAANTIFANAGGGALFTEGGAITGNAVFSAGAQTVISAVSAAFTIYAVATILAGILFACEEEEIELAVKKALRSTHYLGSYCSKRFFGCLERKRSYCAFSSPLSRIMNEQIRLQNGRSWGTPENPECGGITFAEFEALDMNSIDLSEWTGIMMENGLINFDGVGDIERLTGPDSTLGWAQEDLYEREDAVERNVNRIGTIDIDGLRGDAVGDFGSGTVRP